MSFSKGDVVSVKSGGPALTVLSVEGEHVTCLFFSEELGDFKHTTIPAFALETFDESADLEDEDDEEAEGTDGEDDEEEDEDDETDDKAA